MHSDASQNATSLASPTVWYSYALLRVVPHVERGEGINVGVILFAREAAYLDARIELDAERLRLLDPDVDLPMVERHLRTFCDICAGRPEGGPLAALPPSERFHWLTAPRSTMIQASPVHVGRASDPAAALEELMDELVRRPRVAGAALRPDPETLGRAWRELVVAEREQVERLREWEMGDYYAPIAQHFIDDPRREGDALLDLLRSFSRPDATWLDVGAGAGRYALPLALASREVIAVEPSEGMRQALVEGMQRHGITNVRVLPYRWPEGAEDVQADLALIAHVGYDIEEIHPFLDALERATRERCIAVVLDRAPSSRFAGLWEAIHGEPRLLLPGARELVQLLLARGVLPEIRLLPWEQRPVTEEELLPMVRRRLWLAEGSAKDRRLQQLLAEQSDTLARDPGAATQLAVISWSPRR